MGMSSGLGEVLWYAQLPFFGSKLAGRMCNLPNIAVTPASSLAVARRGDSARALVTGVTGSDVTLLLGQGRGKGGGQEDALCAGGQAGRGRGASGAPATGNP